MKNVKFAVGVGVCLLVFTFGCIGSVIEEPSGIGGNVTSSSSSSSSSRECSKIGYAQHNEPCANDCDCHCGICGGPVSTVDGGPVKKICLTGCY